MEEIVVAPQSALTWSSHSINRLVLLIFGLQLILCDHSKQRHKTMRAGCNYVTFVATIAFIKVNKIVQLSDYQHSEASNLLAFIFVNRI